MPTKKKNRDRTNSTTPTLTTNYMLHRRVNIEYKRYSTRVTRGAIFTRRHGGVRARQCKTQPPTQHREKEIQDGDASPLLRVRELLPTRVIDRPVPVRRVCICGTSAGEAQLWYGYVDPVIFIFVRGALILWVAHRARYPWRRDRDA